MMPIWRAKSNIFSVGPLLEMAYAREPFVRRNKNIRGNLVRSALRQNLPEIIWAINDATFEINAIGSNVTFIQLIYCQI